MKEYKHAVYIGRFQPFHNGHLEVVKRGLELADQLVVLVGSAHAAPNIKNPWFFEERKSMILGSLESIGVKNDWSLGPIHVEPLRDYYYNENAWIAQVQSKTHFVDDHSTVLIGGYKDESSFYLKYFPQWDFKPVVPESVNGTAIRTSMFRTMNPPDWEGKTKPDWDVKNAPCPPNVKQFLSEFTNTYRFTNLVKEYHFIESYKNSWKNAPFPPTFVTTDAVVVCSGHVLLVKRKFNPGEGLWALPGGFLKQNEKIKDGALRELKEETRIKVDKLILDSSIVDQHVFDHPHRSLRGRTITHGFYIRLKDGRLPEVKADDDALEVQWMPLVDVQRFSESFYEDHAHIIDYFLGRV